MTLTPSEVVADASVAAKWHLQDEEHVAQAGQLLAAVLGGRFSLVVPEIWRFEVGSIFSKAVANRRVTEAEGRTALADTLLVPHVAFSPPDPVAAYEAARRFNRTIFDGFYLALAEERGCDFWTDDRKLVRALSNSYPFVPWIGNYPIPP
jgi:predicted nucleic acid-binding protein